MRDVLICGRCGGRVKPKVRSVRKDGTVPRQYVCYWAGTSKKDLIASGRKKKCSLPFIETKPIESRVWAQFMMGFVFSPTIILENLYNSKKQKNKMNQLQETINRLELELNKKNRARKNLYKLLEEEDTNIGELKDRLRINNDEILTLKGNLNDTQSEYQELVSISENEKDISNFLRNNKNLLGKVRKDVFNLNLKDRKLLIESSLMDKVIVNYQEDNEIDGPGGPTCEFKLNTNIELLQRFMEEGKITNLDKNSRDLRPRPDFGTLEIRIMDTQPTVGEAIAIAAFSQSLIEYLKLYSEEAEGKLLRPLPLWIEQENRFRACQHGLDAMYVEDESGNSRPIRDIAEDILNSTKETADNLGVSQELAGIAEILSNGPSYIRQRNVYGETGSYKAVVSCIAGELESEIKEFNLVQVGM